MKRVRVGWAIVLSIIYPGLGQIYKGQIAKGIVFILMELVFIYILFITLGFFGLPAILIWICGIVDASFKEGLVEVTTSTMVKRLVLIVCILISLIFMLDVASSPYRLSKDEKAVIEKEVKGYLFTKYSQQFEVKKIRYIKTADGFCEITVYPKNNPNIEFMVRSHMLSNHQYVDDYLGEVWQTQAEEEIKPLLYRLYGNVPPFLLSIDKIDLPLEKIQSKNKVPDFKEVRKEFSSKLSIGFQIHLFTNINEENKDVAAQKIFEVIKTFKDQGYKDIHVTASYYNPELEKEAQSIFKEEGIDKAGQFLRNHYKQELAICRIDSENMKKVISIQDVENFLTFYQKK